MNPTALTAPPCLSPLRPTRTSWLTNSLMETMGGGPAAPRVRTSNPTIGTPRGPQTNGLRRQIIAQYLALTRAVYKALLALSSRLATMNAATTVPGHSKRDWNMAPVKSLLIGLHGTFTDGSSLADQTNSNSTTPVRLEAIIAGPNYRIRTDKGKNSFTLPAATPSSSRRTTPPPLLANTSSNSSQRPILLTTTAKRSFAATTAASSPSTPGQLPAPDSFSNPNTYAKGFTTPMGMDNLNKTIILDKHQVTAQIASGLKELYKRLGPDLGITFEECFPAIPTVDSTATSLTEVNGVLFETYSVSFTVLTRLVPYLEAGLMDPDSPLGQFCIYNGLRPSSPTPTVAAGAPLLFLVPPAIPPIAVNQICCNVEYSQGMYDPDLTPIQNLHRALDNFQASSAASITRSGNPGMELDTAVGLDTLYNNYYCAGSLLMDIRVTSQNGRGGIYIQPNTLLAHDALIGCGEVTCYWPPEQNGEVGGWVSFTTTSALAPSHSLAINMPYRPSRAVLEDFFLMLGNILLVG